MKINPYQALTKATLGTSASGGNQTADGAAFQAELENSKVEVDKLQQSAQSAQESGDLEALKKVAKEFEEIFVNMLLKSMRSTIMDGGLTEKSNQRGIFEGMLDEEFAKQISEKGGIGIQDMMVRQLQRYVDNTPPETPDSSAPEAVSPVEGANDGVSETTTNPQPTQPQPTQPQPAAGIDLKG